MDNINGAITCTKLDKLVGMVGLYEFSISSPNNLYFQRIKKPIAEFLELVIASN